MTVCVLVLDPHGRARRLRFHPPAPARVRCPRCTGVVDVEREVSGWTREVCGCGFRTIRFTVRAAMELAA